MHYRLSGILLTFLSILLIFCSFSSVFAAPHWFGYGVTDAQPRKKLFYANGYFWAFAQSAGNLSYWSSSDGVSWSAITKVRNSSDAERFEVRYFPSYSSSYCYYVISTAADIFNQIVFCRGTLGSGSITWGTEYVVAQYSSYGLRMPSVGVATDGTVWVMLDFGIPGGNHQERCWRNLVNDGSGSWVYNWTTGNLIFADAHDFLYGSLQELSGAKMLAVYGGSTPFNLYSRYFNASNNGGWEPQVQITSNTMDENLFDCVSWADNVTMQYHSVNGTGPVKCINFTAGLGWGNEAVYDVDANIPNAISADGLGNTFLTYHKAVLWQLFVIERYYDGSFSSSVKIEDLGVGYDVSDNMLCERLIGNSVYFDWYDPFNSSAMALDFYNFTITVSWHNVSLWLIQLQTRQWTSVANWLIQLQARQWTSVSAWQIQLLTRGWNSITTWQIILTGKGWFTITAWFIELTTADYAYLIIPILLIVVLVAGLFCFVLRKKIL